MQKQNVLQVYRVKFLGSFNNHTLAGISRAANINYLYMKMCNKLLMCARDDYQMACDDDTHVSGSPRHTYLSVQSCFIKHQTFIDGVLVN